MKAAAFSSSHVGLFPLMLLTLSADNRVNVMDKASGANRDVVHVRLDDALNELMFHLKVFSFFTLKIQHEFLKIFRDCSSSDGKN